VKIEQLTVEIPSEYIGLLVERYEAQQGYQECLMFLSVSVEKMSLVSRCICLSDLPTDLIVFYNSLYP
jgi:hypothetical protein